MVALVGDDFLDHRHGVIGDGGDRFELVGGFGQHLLKRRRVAVVGVLHRDADDTTRFEIDGVLGLVGQMRPAVFHLRDLGGRDRVDASNHRSTHPNYARRDVVVGRGVPEVYRVDVDLEPLC
ncbi:MAG: hypothetical protein AUF76_17730 [Acidobacteria bacterium 13_1_20CM_2_65_9]|nr:MAG: hypothetical protein AUF76_17730 [Acidobacteria bacterium 13_1_20CM_2_65_9]